MDLLREMSSLDMQRIYYYEELGACSALVTSVSMLPSLSSPEMVGVGFVAFKVLPFVARGCGVLVARKWIELVSL